MSGVLATIKLMFTAVQLQRLFLRVCGLLALLGAAGMIAAALGIPKWWTPVAILCACLLLAPAPPLMGGVLLRSWGASRAIRLMPQARLRLLLGCLFAQALVALIAATTAITIIAYSGNPPFHDHICAELAAVAPFFVFVFAVATLGVITMYYSSAHRLGMLIPLICAFILKALAVAFPHWHIDEFPGSAPALLVVFIGTLCLWALFALAYLRGGRIRPLALRGWDSVLVQWLAGADGQLPTVQSERNAMRVLLTGRSLGHRISRSMLGIGAGLLAWFLLSTFNGSHGLHTGEEKVLAALTAYVGGLATAAAIHPLIGRARYLWLKTGLDRRQLFRAVEVESWRTLLTVGVFALAVSVCLCVLARVPWVVVTQILLLSLVCGAALIYLVLLSTREWPVMDALLVAALSALWFVGLMASAFGGGSRWLPLFAPGLLLVPLLRIWARSRWARIDWIVNRPLRLPGR